MHVFYNGLASCHRHHAVHDVRCNNYMKILVSDPQNETNRYSTNQDRLEKNLRKIECLTATGCSTTKSSTHPRQAKAGGLCFAISVEVFISLQTKTVTNYCDSIQKSNRTCRKQIQTSRVHAVSGSVPRTFRRVVRKSIR